MKELLNTLYVQTQGSYLRLEHDTLKIDMEAGRRRRFRCIIWAGWWSSATSS